MIQVCTLENDIKVKYLYDRLSIYQLKNLYFLLDIFFTFFIEFFLGVGIRHGWGSTSIAPQDKDHVLPIQTLVLSNWKFGLFRWQCICSGDNLVSGLAFFAPLIVLFFLMGPLMTSYLPSTGRSLDCLLPEPSLLPQSLSSGVSEVRPAHLDSTESAEPLQGMVKLMPVQVILQNTSFSIMNQSLCIIMN